VVILWFWLVWFGEKGSDLLGVRGLGFADFVKEFFRFREGPEKL